jgi:hypothetical protein
MTTVPAILTDGAGNALIDGFNNALTVPFTFPPPPPTDNEFLACIDLAEMHRQSAYAAARATFAGRLLQRAIRIADHQYFLEILDCAVQFNRSAPSAVDGLQDMTNQLINPEPGTSPASVSVFITTEAGDKLTTEAGAFIIMEQPS